MNRFRSGCGLALVAIGSLGWGTTTRAADDGLLRQVPPGAVKSEPAAPMSPDEMRQAGEHATRAAEKLGWRIGVQAWTFNRRSFFDTVDQVHALGLHYIEAFPGQRIDKDRNVKFGPDLTPEQREQVKKKLADADVKLVNFGVTPLSKDEAESRKTFDFAKDMGIETIVSEPPEDAFDTLDKLVEEYGINVAIHDHPKPSHYWNPDTVLKVVQGRSARIGSCADVGHWQRSGVDPIEALRKLQGRIISSHFKDLDQFGNPAAIDVPWGTGVGNAKGMLEEIHRQNAKIVFSVEYEHYTPGLVNDVARSLVFFGDTCDELAKEQK